MIINVAYEIVRESGEENINARNIAEKLGCSTQPVLYVFKTMNEIRECVYQKADEKHLFTEAEYENILGMIKRGVLKEMEDKDGTKNT